MCVCISHRSALGVGPQLLFTMLSDALDLGNLARVAPRTLRNAAVSLVLCWH